MLGSGTSEKSGCRAQKRANDVSFSSGSLEHVL